MGEATRTEASDTRTDDQKKTSYEKYNSITKEEYIHAATNGIPVYILIERAVYSDYETYRLNKDNRDVNYAHVNSTNVFSLIESILREPRNNPIQQFERFADIREWLMEQWAGYFRELLKGPRENASLAARNKALTEENHTLKTLLEQVRREAVVAKRC